MISPELAAIFFGLAASASWGAGEFSGSLATKRASVISVIAFAHVVGFVILFNRPGAIACCKCPRPFSRPCHRRRTEVDTTFGFTSPRQCCPRASSELRRSGRHGAGAGGVEDRRRGLGAGVVDAPGLQLAHQRVEALIADRTGQPDPRVRNRVVDLGDWRARPSGASPAVARTRPSARLDDSALGFRETGISRLICWALDPRLYLADENGPAGYASVHACPALD